MAIAPAPHTRRENSTDDWITPRWILEAFGPFELDPCASATQPWPTADQMYKPPAADGLLLPWKGFVFCNPPYGRALGAWLNRMALHNNGIALTFARTETRAFRDYVWPFATCLMFLHGRVTFHLPNGEMSKAGHNSGGPSVLIGYGYPALSRMARCTRYGSLVTPL